jgi:hypothetical protein
MTDKKIFVSPLMKVGLMIRVTPDEKSSDPVRLVPFNFFYGIGSEGIAPFEVLLAGKTIGEKLTLRVGDNQIGDVFGHLACAAAQAIGFDPPWHMEAAIVSIEKPADRDLIRAMAQAGGCAGGCDCGCGS